MTAAPEGRRPPIDWGVARAVAAKDMRAISRSKAVMYPMLLVPLMLLVVVPALIGGAALTKQTFNIQGLLDAVPGDLLRPIAKLPEGEQLLVLVLGYLLAPMFIVVPLMVSAVVAADTFAGEKDRRTLESLLHLPVGDREMLIGKISVSLLPALAISWIGFIVYCICANSIAWPKVHRVFVPTAQWMVVILWVAPAVTVLGLGVMVRVSARARSSQEANQLGGAVVLPLIFLAVAQSTGLLLMPSWAGMLVGLAVWAVALWVLVRGARSFTRDRLAARI